MIAEHTRRHGDTGMGKIVKWWPLILYLITGIITITMIYSSVKNIEPRVCTLEKEAELDRLEMRQMQTQYNFIIGMLKEIKEDIKYRHPRQ